MRSMILTTTYDDKADAAYIAFDEIASGEAVRQIIVDDEELGPLSVILDVDRNGKLLGIELLDVTRVVARPRLL
ncbi:DUF2283 domain-containing protein [Leifsonia shinshuensis]|uniref:Uncharacterized protein YuzE n=1 Tax=Leifsonia shinshuensis TaxID=150026 RepID=A0A853CXI9_9MICO|nr:DUF2283 domain-containing protein [Leifsonia shinshuensis]NYJ24071.1 uncharacterized protein YuzE [Leifsonia shinshuensis]